MIWRKCIILRIIPQKGGIDVEHAYSLKKNFFERLLESLVRLIGRSLCLPKPDNREEVPSSDAQTPTHSYKKHEESVKYNPTKGEKNKSRVINSKEMETYKLPDKKFKIIILISLMNHKKAQSEDKTKSGKSDMHKMRREQNELEIIKKVPNIIKELKRKTTKLKHQ